MTNNDENTHAIAIVMEKYIKSKTENRNMENKLLAELCHEIINLLKENLELQTQLIEKEENKK